MPKRLDLKSREKRRKKPPQNAKGVKWFGATTTATKESRDVTVFPIDAQKWTLSCFRRFFRLCAQRVSSKRHKRNNACGTPTCPNATADVENFETRISNDHERRDRRIGRPRGVVVARGRRAKGTNDDGRCSFWMMMMMMMMMMGSTSSPPAIRDGGCLSFFSLSLSLSFSLSSKAKTNERRDAKSRRHLLTRVLFSSSSSSHSSMVCCLPPLLCFFFCLKHKTNTGPNLRRVRNVSRGHGSLENAPRDGRVPGR